MQKVKKIPQRQCVGCRTKRDKRDLLRIVKTPEGEIVLYGVSMGAATVMMASGEADLPVQVRCVIEDCGYTSVWDEFSGQLKELFGLPPFPVLNAADLVCRIRAGYSITEHMGSAEENVEALWNESPLKYAPRCKTPTLFIHGEEDTFVPFWMLEELYQAASCEKEKLVVPGAAHAESAAVAPELYWPAVDAFLARHMA